MFKPFLRKFVVVHFDDILVFSKIKEKLFEHLMQVMMVLKQKQLYGDQKKCSFFTLEVAFLGNIVSVKGIQVDQSKVNAIKSWLVPSSMHDVRSFYGLASFYRKFIHHSISIFAPITKVLKGIKFILTPQAQSSFEEAYSCTSFSLNLILTTCLKYSVMPPKSQRCSFDIRKDAPCLF